jgi:hypothetical protein
MAKKIIIDFNAQPITTGQGFLYTIQVSGFDIYYSNGYNECKVNFIPNGDTPANYYEVAIGTTLDETLQITLSFLRENYVNELISYSLVDSTIEVLIQADATVNVDSDVNDSITITQSTVEPTGENLKYYLIFDNYVLNIYKSNYVGSSSEIFGTFVIKKSTVDSILTPIRGTALEISLEANQDLTFDEFLLEDEFTYKTELLKNGQSIFKGYIKPDGIQQSYVNDEWYINIESNDVLGALKDLSFVQGNGLTFTGMMSIYDVIKGCLDRTLLAMDIYTSITVEYVGYAGNNILKDVFVSADRFIKNQNDTVIMDCNEVLTSMLNLFSGVITQQNGKWWIYRPNDLVLNGYTEFINQTTDTSALYNLNAVLGSQVNNFYPHHCDANQQIEVKGAISAYRLNYQYGFLDGFVNNPNLNHNEEMVFTDWTTNPSLPTANIIIVNDALSLSGLKMIVKEGSGAISVLTSNTFAAYSNSILTFKTQVTTRQTGGFYVGTDVQFIIKITTSDGYFLNGANQWSLTDSFIRVRTKARYNVETSLSYELLMPPVPNNCDMTITIREVRLTLGSSQITAGINYIQILDNELQKNGIVGEFHTVTRALPPSSITKENQKVFNGDGSEILIGSIYKDDLETPTSVWSRKNKFETLPLLGISAMDDLRIQSSPIKAFSGSVFGELPYMSVITIDNVNGLFMPIEYNYNPKTNTSDSIKLLEFYNSDLGDIEYTVSPDYGNSTIKPTIKG